jgi:hypothetical protein
VRQDAGDILAVPSGLWHSVVSDAGINAIGEWYERGDGMGGRPRSPDHLLTYLLTTYLLTYYRDMMLDSTVVNVVCRRALSLVSGGVLTRHPFRIRINRDMRCWTESITVVCRRALGCEWGCINKDRTGQC